MSPTPKPLPLPLKALAALETIPSVVFCNCLANLVTGGAQVLSAVDPIVLTATAAVAGLIGLRRWSKDRKLQKQAEIVTNLLRQSANDSLTALDLIADIAKGKLKVSVKIDNDLKGELQDACRRAIAARTEGLSEKDAGLILDAIRQTATREQIEAFELKFDDFSSEVRVLLWTQDHRGREQDAILRETHDSVARVDVNVNRMAEVADALERRFNETDEQVVARLRPLIEKDVASKMRTEFDQQLRDRDETIDRLTRGAVRAANVPGLIEELRKTGDGRKIFEALRQVSTHTDADFIEVHRGIAEWAFLTGAIDDARRSIDRILALLPDDVDALNRLGHIHRLRGELADAERSYRRVLELSSDNAEGQAIAYGNLGLIHRTRGALDQAEAMHNKALAIDEKLGRLEGMASDYGNLGVIYRARGDLDQAEGLHKKSLAIEEKLGRLEGMADQYGNLGLTYKTRGDLDQAEAMHKKSLAINEKLGRLEGMASDYGNLGGVYRARGDLDQADTMLKKSLAIDEKLGRLEGMASEYGNLGGVYQTRGELDQAEAMHKKSLAINEKLGRMEGMAATYGNLGTVYMLRGNVAAARKYWTKARDTYTKAQMPHMAAKMQGWLDALPKE